MNSSETHELRLRNLRETLHTRNLDAFLVTDINNVFYLTGFTGSTAAALITLSDAYLLVDPRYSVQARSECRSVEVQVYRGKSLIEAACDLANHLTPRLLTYEADDLTVSLLRRLQSGLQNTRLRSSVGVIRRFRQVKDAYELSLIRRAVEIADSTFDSVVGQIKPGLSEKDLELLIDTTLRKLGADKEAFDTIAASGPNSACPHAQPTDRLISSGDLVKLDFGARFRHYHSDLTRTISIGRADAKRREVYSIVLEAQSKAIEAIRPGRTCKEIDSVARAVIASAGYAENFGHGLGHALGIELHEEPRFSQLSEAVLEPGMVMTVEPGIYIENWGGVRIEDVIVVTETGCEVLTRAAKKELLTL